ncbi:MAG: tRNA (adenosine(37)-N6)-threonylcarbamoyltransferase complex ATPase subunit type 1 TsaE [Brevibacterium sp.]
MRLHVESLRQMRTFAEALAGHLQAGDLLILTGNLGAGKTTFTQSLGRALGVAGRITSPTFIIAREHPSLSEGPALVHVDAYRLSDAEELGDLDLDSELEESITVVEWGAGLAEQLSTDYLQLTITPAWAEGAVDFAGDADLADDPELDDERRSIDLFGHGSGWDERLARLGASLAELFELEANADRTGGTDTGPDTDKDRA